MPQIKVKKGKRATKPENNAMAEMMKAMGIDMKRLMTDPAYSQQLLKQYKPMMESVNSQDMQQMMQSVMPMMQQLKDVLPALKDMTEIMGEMNSTLKEDEEEENDGENKQVNNDDEDDEDKDAET